MGWYDMLAMLIWKSMGRALPPYRVEAGEGFIAGDCQNAEGFIAGAAAADVFIAGAAFDAQQTAVGMADGRSG